MSGEICRLVLNDRNFERMTDAVDSENDRVLTVLVLRPVNPHIDRQSSRYSQTRPSLQALGHAGYVAAILQ